MGPVKDNLGMIKFFNCLRNDRGILSEIPLILAGYGVLCGLLIPLLQRLFPGWNVIVIIVFMILGLIVSCFIGRSITVPRVYVVKSPLCFWAYLLLSCLTLPLLSTYDNSVFAPVILMGQVFAAFWVDLWSAKKKDKKKIGTQ
jgi:MFS-type transporter involved in bile tolerance (Atg22 family)